MLIERNSVNGSLTISRYVKDLGYLVTQTYYDYTRKVGFTDLPEGVWTFFVCDDGDDTLRCILPTEY